jgi:hypothetical protein
MPTAKLMANTHSGYRARQDRSWNLARQLLAENESVRCLNLEKLADGDVDLLDRLKLVCQCPFLVDAELDILLKTPWLAPKVPAHRIPVVVSGEGMLWMHNGVPLSLNFAGIEG